MARVIIVVEGGCVQNVLADTKDIEVLLIDHDNIEEGDTPEPGFPVEVAPQQVDEIWNDPLGEK